MQANHLVRRLLVLIALLLPFATAQAVPLLISITNPPGAVTVNAAGGGQFWPNAGTLGPGGVPISLRATVTSISPGDSVTLFTSGDNPVVRANTGTLSATVLWEVFNRATGLPIVGDPDFLITDIDGRRGNPIESVSAACEGLTSFTTNGGFLPGCNANNNNACQTNIRVTESGGTILAEGTQNQNGNQQEGYMQYSWTDVSQWTVNYFATSGGRWFVHDADGDIPFDGTEVLTDLVDLATIKGVSAGSLTSPAQGEQITFQIDLSNFGPEIATNANLIDQLPAGVNYLSHTATSGIYNPVNGEWNGVNIAVNGVETLTITAEVTAAAGTTVTNQTTTALSDQSGCSSRDLLEYSFVVAETPAPSLTVAKSVSSATSFNQALDTITYSYLVTNTGNVNIDNVAPVDNGPTFGGQPATNTLSAFNPPSVTLTPGTSQTFTATYILDQADVDNMAGDANPLSGIDNSATASGTPTGGALPPVTASMVETGFAPTPSLSVVKSVTNATAFSQAGDSIVYQYVVQNTGNITIAAATPTDTGSTFNGMPATNGLSAISPAPVSLAPGDSQIFTATYELNQIDIDNMAAAVDPLTAIDNTAGATGVPAGGIALPAVPTSMVETGFMPAPVLEIIKTVAAPLPSAAGDTITYNYQVINSGNVTINNVMPVDSGPTFGGAAAGNSLSAYTPAAANIAPQTGLLFTATYVISQADVDNMFASGAPATAIDNSATASGTPVGGVLPNVPASVAETGFVLSASLAIDKTAGIPTQGLGAIASATDAGDTIAYSFEVTNDGDVVVDSIVVNDSGPTFNGNAASGTFSAISCPVTTLQPDQSTTCTATYTLSQADIDAAIEGGANSIDNSATVSGDDPANDSVTSPSDTAETSIDAEAEIGISKTAGTPTVALGADATLTDPGDTILFTLVAENTGNTTLGNVNIVDSLIGTINCPATTAQGVAFTNGTGTLTPGDSISCTGTYTITQPNVDAGQVLNTATVSGDDPAGMGVNNSDSEVVGFTQNASLNMVKTSLLPAPSAADDVVTYEFAVENTGNVTLTAPTVTDAQCETPAGTLTFADGYISGDSTANGALDSDETWIFRCTYMAVTGDFNLGEINNTASVTGTPPAGLAPPTSVATHQVIAVQSASLSLIKVAGAPTTNSGLSASLTDEGDTVAYSFTVENTGNVDLTALDLSDPLLGGPVTCPPAAVIPPGGVVVCNGTYTLDQTDVDAGMVSNTATVSATPPAGVPAPQAMSSAMVVIAPSPGMTVQKSVAPLPANLIAGSTISYSYTVENTGNVTINGASPVDAGPTFNGAAATNSLSAFSPASATLEPGDTQIFTATYLLDQVDIDNMAAAADPTTAIDNTATADGTPAGGVLAPVTPSTVETGVVANPQIELEKSSTAPALVQAGGLISYDFSLENTGNVSITNPTVTDAQCQTPGSVLTRTSGYLSGDAGTANVLDVGETWNFQCSYAISQADIDAGTVQNTATATGQDPSGATVTDDSDSQNGGDDTGADDDPTNTPLARTPSWTVVKSTASAPSVAGDTLLYSFVVDNTGNASISSVSVSDGKCAAVPALVGGDANGNNILEPTEVWTYTCTSIPVTQAEIDAGTVDNNVSVSGTPPAGSPALPAATDILMTPVAEVLDLDLAKTAGAPTTGGGAITTATDAGDTITFSYAVTNNSNVTLDSLVINDAGPTFNAGANSPIAAASCALTTLAPGQSTTCTAVYTLTQPDIDAAIAGGADSVENTAIATAQTPANAAVNSPSSTANTTISGAAELLMTKTAAAPSVDQGVDATIVDPDDTIDFTLLVENTGNATVTGITVSDTVTDTVTGDLVLLVTCPANTVLGTPFTNGSGSLAVGDSIACTATHIIDQSNLDDGMVSNTGTVSGVDPQNTPVNSLDQAVVPFTQQTSLLLVKSAVENFAVVPPNDAPNPTDTIDYTFTLTNTGNVSLTAPQVDDAKCPVTPLTTMDTESIVVDGILQAGETATFSCTLTIAIADIDAGEVANSAVATGTPPVSSGLPNPTGTAGTLTELDQETGISMIKMGSMPTTALGSLPTATDPGDTIDYTFEITNTGNVTLDPIVVTDPKITDAPNNGTINCPLTALVTAASTICTATYTITQADVDAGAVDNMASTSGTPPASVPPTPPPSAQSSSMVPVAPVPSLEVVKSASALTAPVLAGTIINYSFEVTNTGNVTISDVSPVDLGPTFNGVNGTSALSNFSPAPLTLAPGDSQVFTATYPISQIDLDNLGAAASPLTAISNQATADGEPANGPALVVPPSSVDTGVVPEPELELRKSSVAPAAVTPGSLITYTFELENTGNVTVANPIVNDAQCQLPGSQLSFGSGYVSGDNGVIAGSLDVGETWVFNCDYAITQADIDAGVIQNTADAVGQDPAGNNVVDDSDSQNAGDDTGANDDPTNTPLARTATWNVVKATASTPMAAGETLDYTFAVTNTGNVSITNVVVGDIKCAAVPSFIGGDADGNTELSPGEVWNYSCTSIPVTQAEANAGSVDNNVVVSGNPPAGGPNPPTLVNAEDDLQTPLPPSASLAVVKSAAAPTVGAGAIPTATDAGDSITYSFAITNDGNVTIDNIVINDQAPTFNGVTAVNSIGPITCALTTLTPLQSTTCSGTYVLAQADVDNAIEGGTDAVANTATAEGEDPNDNPVTSPAGDATTTIVSVPNIEVAKTLSLTTPNPTLVLGADPSLSDPGDTLSFDLAVSNTGNAILQSVNVTDSIAAVTCPATTSLGAAFVNGAGVLAVGDSIICSAVYPMVQTDFDSGLVTNVGSAAAQDLQGNATSDDDQLMTALNQKTSILLAKSADESGLQTPPQVGDSIVYSFDLTNTGNVSLSGASVTDPKCVNSPLVRGSVEFDSGDTNNNLVLDAGETWAFSCTRIVEATDIDGAGVANTATGTGTPPAATGLPDPSSTAATQTVLDQETGISLIKVGGAPTIAAGIDSTFSDVGDTIAYTFTVENTGNVTLSNVAVTDPTITGAPNNGTITCADTTLVSTAAATPPVSVSQTTCTASYTLTQTDIDAGEVMNSATVQGDPPPPVGSNPPVPPPSGLSSTTVPVPPRPQLEVTKSVSSLPAQPLVAGVSTITYQYDVENIGNVTIDNVQPVDAGPTFNNVAGTNTLGVFSPAAVSLAPTASQAFTADYVLSQIDIDNMTAATDSLTAVDNLATAAGDPVNGSLQPVTPSDVETGVAASPQITLRKSSTAPAGVVVGALVVYDFELENTGDVTIANPTISDARCQIPAGPLSFANGFVSGDTGANPASLDVGETWNFACSYAITQADIDAGTVQNTATSLGQDPAGNSVTDDSDSQNAGDDTGANDDPTNTELARTASWTVAKTTTSVPTSVGDTLIYSFVVTNTGNTSIASVAVNDVKCAAAPVLQSGDTDTNNVLAPTEVWTYSCTSIPVTQLEVDTGMVDNNVTVVGTPPTSGPNPPTLVDATDSLSTPIIANPSLAITKSAAAPTIGFGVLPAATDALDTIVYSFEVTNTGNVTIDSIVVNDLGITFGSVASTNALGAINCPLSELVPTQSTVCTATYVLDQADVDNAIAAGANSVENAATAQGDDPNDNTVTSPQGDALATIDSMPAIEIAKTLSTAVTPNPSVANGIAGITDPDDTLTYNLQLTNTGNAPLDNISVIDSLTTVTCPANTLAVGASIDCTAIYTLTQADFDTGSVTNQATVSAEDEQGTSVNANDQLVTALTQETSVMLIKTAVEDFDVVAPNGTPDEGDNIVYTFMLTNTGNVSLSAPQVSDPKCPGSPLTVPSSGDGPVVGILEANETWEFSCTYTVLTADINDGGVDNQAVGTGTPPATSGLPAPTSTAGTQSVLDQEPAIAFEKSASMPTVDQGADNSFTDADDIITFTFRLENTGNVTLDMIEVDDALCPTTPLTTPDSGDINTDLLMDPNEVWVFSCQYPVTQADLNSGEVMNTATVTTNAPVPVTVPPTPPAPPPSGVSSAMVPLPPVARLEVSKDVMTLPAMPLVAGVSTIVYQYTVTNVGNVTMADVTPIDAGPTFNGVAGTNNPLGAFTPAPVTLAPTDSQVFTASYILSQVDIDNMAASATPTMAVNNSATATGTPDNGNLDPVAPSAVATGIAPSSGLELRKSFTAPSVVAAGALIVYDFELENTGDVTISTPTISDPLCETPANPLGFANGFTGGDTGTIAQSLDVGEIWTFSCSYAINQTDIDNGQVINNASANGFDPAGNPVLPATAMATTPLPRNSAWQVIKSTTSIPTAAGDTLEYSFRVTNLGNVNIGSIVPTDIKCASGPNLVVATDLGADDIISPAGANGSPAAESWTYTCTSNPIDQTEVDAGVVNNTISIAGQPPAGSPALPPAVDELNTPVTAAPGLSVIKSISGVVDTNADQILPNDGDTVNYSYQVTNVGNISIFNTFLTDTHTGSGTPPVPDNAVLTNTSGLSADVAGDNSVDTLAPGDFATFTASYQLTAADLAAGGISNSAEATGAGPVPAGGGTAPTVTDTSDAGTEPNGDGGVTTVPNPETTETPNSLDDPQTNGDPTDDPTSLILPPTLTVGGFVWQDLNGDGIQDANEPPIPGAMVSLLVEQTPGVFVPAEDLTGNVLPSITVGANGVYSFVENLPEGNYRVQIEGATGFFPTPVSGVADTDVEDDSNTEFETSTGIYQSGTFALTAGGEPNEVNGARGDDVDGSAGGFTDLNGNTTIDFGFVLPASIGNFVWLDLDADGVQDANEDGIANVVVELFADSDGNGTIDGAELTTPVAMATTGTNGEYLFPNLMPGTAYLTMVDSTTVPAGLAQTFDDGAGGLDNTSAPIDLDPGEEHLTADFGYGPIAGTGTIGDTIWIDANDDGVQNPGEPGLAGVTVTIFPSADVDAGAGDGNPVTVVTDANGKYLFTGLPVDENYLIEVTSGVPADYSIAPSGNGDPDVRDGNSDPADANEQTIVVLTAAQPANLDADFGYLPAPSVNNVISSTIWNDVNRDGVVDAGEAPIAGVTVTLIDDAGNTVATAITDANGNYSFNGLPDGMYIVVVTDQNSVLGGLVPTHDGDDPANPGAFDANTPNASVISVAGGVVNTDQRFGYSNPDNNTGGGSIGDTIFFDEDNSGTPEAGEGLEGVTVQLFNPGPDGIAGNADDFLAASTVTDENGNYLFTGLSTDDTNGAGGTDYRVVVDNTSLPNGGAGWLNTVDPESTITGAGDNNSVVTLSAAAPSDLEQNFGYSSQDNNRIEGVVWSDSNGDGEQQEPGGLGGVTIELRDDNGNVIQTTETLADGSYVFENLPDGAYVVVVTDDDNVLSGLEHTDSPNGPSDTADQTSKDDTGYRIDLDSAGASATPVTDVSGDFGYQPTVTNPISLGSFSTTLVEPGTVLVEWLTQTEVSNIGFYVYGLVDGEWARLNESLILSNGDSVSVQSYQATFSTSATVFALADIDLGGKETLHGAFRLGEAYGVVGERRVIDWKAEKLERETKQLEREQLRKQQQRQRNEQRKLRRNAAPTSLLDLELDAEFASLLSSTIIWDQAFSTGFEYKQ